MRKSYVVFLSPGTLFHETTSKLIDSWDVKKAVEISQDIIERYNARPYGFYFATYIEHGEIPDNEGGFLKVEPKLVSKSGIYHLNSKLLTMNDVANKEGKDSILYCNMISNGFFIVAENTNSFRSTHPFNQEDFLIDWEGNILDQGNSEAWQEYRKIWEEKAKEYSNRYED